MNRNNFVKLYYSTAITDETGSDFDVTGIAWQYRFGGGLYTICWELHGDER